MAAVAFGMKTVPIQWWIIPSGTSMSRPPGRARRRSITSSPLRRSRSNRWRSAAGRVSIHRKGVAGRASAAAT